MPKYVYGIVKQEAPAPDAPGIGEARLHTIAAAGVAALVSDLDADDLQLGRDELVRHGAVLERALSQGTVLPMRFGVVMADADTVRGDLLERHAEHLHAQFAQLDGKVELNVRAVYDEAVVLGEIVRDDQDISRLRESLRGQPDDATYYGRIRLGELVAEAVQRKRETDAQQVVEALAPGAVAVQIAEPAHERVVVSASFLVDRERIGEFDDSVDRVARAQAERMRFKYAGPLPPHSFVELGEA